MTSLINRRFNNSTIHADIDHRENLLYFSFILRERNTMLSLTTKYAIKALQALHEINSEDFVRVPVLARHSKVPSAYLSKVIGALTVSGIVITRRGANGGVKLNQNFAGLTLHDVCVALRDPVVDDTCVMGKRGCQGSNLCALHEKWSEPKRAMLRFLKQSRLSEM